MTKFKTNTNLLLHYLFKDEDSLTNLAAALNITETCLCAKLLYVGFKPEEVTFIAERYCILEEDVNDLFFVNSNNERDSITKTNASLLLHYLFKAEETLSGLASVLDITEACLYAKILYVGFEPEEVTSIALKYNVFEEDINDLFFADFNKEREVD